MHGHDVTFPVIQIDSSKLCGGNLHLPIKVKLLLLMFILLGTG